MSTARGHPLPIHHSQNLSISKEDHSARNVVKTVLVCAVGRVEREINALEVAGLARVIASIQRLLRLHHEVDGENLQRPVKLVREELDVDLLRVVEILPRVK